MSIHKSIIPAATGIILFLFYFLFHMHYMQRMLDYDQVIYADNIIKSLQQNTLAVFNPHHLHFENSGVLFHKLVVAFLGGEGFVDPVFNNRLRSLLFASLGVMFAFFYFRNMTGKIAWGIAGAIFIGSAHGYLFYAAKVDTAIFPAFAFIALVLILQLALDKASLSPLTGVVFAIFLMFHQYLLFAELLFFIIYLLPGGKRKNENKFSPVRVEKENLHFYIRLRSVLIAGIICSFLVITAYFYAGKTVYNLPFNKANPERKFHVFRDYSFQQWLFLYEASDAQWGYGIQNFNPVHSFHGFTEAFLSRPGDVPRYNLRQDTVYNFGDIFSRQSFVYDVIAVFYLSAIIGSVLFFPLLLARYGKNIIYIIFNLVVYTVFFTYWEPLYLEFWLIPVFLSVAAGILLLNLAAEKLSFYTFGLSRAAGIVALYALTALVLFNNTYFYLIPYSRILKFEGIPSSFKYTHLVSRSIYKIPEHPYESVDQYDGNSK